LYITRLAGIPLYLHWSFLVGAALIALWSGPSGILLTVAMTVGLFGSVVLHELGHALAARRYGIDTAHITLYPFGGVAAIKDMPRNPGAEFVIALAGPLVNGALFVGLTPLWLMTGWSWLGYLMIINLGMGLFNLIPAFPMDGGRIFRAALASQMGWTRASGIAIRVGRVFAWGFIGLGFFTSWNLALIGLFLLFALSVEQRRLAAQTWRGPRPTWRKYSYP